MAASTPTDRECERLAHEFFARHPEIQHEWRQERALLVQWTSLICGLGQPNEVFASINRGGQIAVGVTASDHEDFESRGRPVTDRQIAQKAFEYFVDVLREQGHWPPAA